MDKAEGEFRVSVQGLLCGLLADREQLITLARQWFTESRSQLCGAIWNSVENESDSAEAVVGRIGAPGLGGGNWSAAYTTARFEAVMASLENGIGDAIFHLNADPAVIPVGDCCSAHVSVSSEADSPDWVTLSIQVAYRANRSNEIPAASQLRLVEFFADFAERVRATFGNLASDNSAKRTALETYLPRSPRAALAESASVVRGYSWVTVVSPDVVVRLGGLDGLRATEAFADVVGLKYGGALLRATERFEQYDDDAVSRVFYALAPVLPPGVPRRLPSYGGRAKPKLVFEDAASQ